VTARPFLLLVAVLGTCAAVPAHAQDPVRSPGSRFDHAKHAKLFPTCTTCHLGAAGTGQELWPDTVACAACHDGTIEARVTWQPPAALHRTNLKFDHPTHARAAAAKPAACVTCHSDVGAPWMTIRPLAAERCLNCHGIRTAHLAAPDTACGTCHVALAQAPRLTREDVAEFPAPPSHRDPGFALASGHGAAATAHPPVAVSCATCHAREFCITCHVDAPEQPAIQALDRDPRSVAVHARLDAPPSHRDARFLAGHGAEVRSNPQDCRTCHTQESCWACHAGAPRVAAALFRQSPERGAGARIVRRPPVSHATTFRDRHGSQAAAGAATCAGCHVRPDCLQCHRPNAGQGSGGRGAYHGAGFLTRHPAAAYARETACADCHNVRSFCASCHAQSGLVANRTLTRRYHDAQPFFIAGHGTAARQSLETCVGCHAERDCLTCHAAAAVGGRGFNPHGPGFDAAKLRRTNPEMCSACHGVRIP
jgi:hypothetical protein